jgi:hypothetical protein
MNKLVAEIKLIVAQNKPRTQNNGAQINQPMSKLPAARQNFEFKSTIKSSTAKKVAEISKPIMLSA